MVSWLARDAKDGVTWLIQRGDKANPIIAVDKEGRVLRSFGRGLYKIPHAIRLDSEGNVWTVDAGNSTVIKFSPKGKQLLEIDVGGQPEPAISPLLGATDIAFAPKGRIFISDGYANARASLSTRPTARRFASGAVQARVRASSTCRTPSWRMKTTSSMLLTARTVG
jgi:DNA-binding beta-propeller fold protein YncE